MTADRILALSRFGIRTHLQLRTPYGLRVVCPVVFSYFLLVLRDCAIGLLHVRSGGIVKICLIAILVVLLFLSSHNNLCTLLYPVVLYPYTSAITVAQTTCPKARLVRPDSGLAQVSDRLVLDESRPAYPMV